MKTLVLISHPDLENSRINRRWVEELKKYPERYQGAQGQNQRHRQNEGGGAEKSGARRL